MVASTLVPWSRRSTRRLDGGDVFQAMFDGFEVADGGADLVGWDAHQGAGCRWPLERSPRCGAPLREISLTGMICADRSRRGTGLPVAR